MSEGASDDMITAQLRSETPDDATGEVAADASVESPEQSAPRLQVNTIRIEKFKKIAETEIALGPITYLVGGNNSGKSSVLQAIHTAVSCAQASVELGQRVIAEASLRYSPVADFSLLGHGAPYDNRSGGQRGVVEFEGVAAESMGIPPIALRCTRHGTTTTLVLIDLGLTLALVRSSATRKPCSASTSRG